ncbi:MAG: nitrilase-related carbon-nitrogen hydrolase, partial [Phycisphaeraceae bacterium]
MHVFGLQLDIAWEDKPANFEQVNKLLADQRVPPGSLIVLPEMFSTGYSMNVAEIAEDAGRPAEAFLAQLATRQQSFVIGGVGISVPNLILLN